MTTPIAQQTAKVGANKGQPRVCLWNHRNLPAAGFHIGTPIDVTRIPGDGCATQVVITIGDETSRRKVSRVKNHGNVLPVIDLKGSVVADMGPRVLVEFFPGTIRITPEVGGE